MRQNFKQVFKLTIPVLGAYWFLGITYGLLASEMGYSIWVPVSMAMIVYSGSVEFIALTMMLGSFHPLASIAMALMVSARHLFYGISMLERYRGAGWRKPFLIYLLTDETFAVNYANKGAFKQQLWVSVLDYLYWISGGIMGYYLGGTLGDVLTQHLQGLDFVVTAMFVAIFMDDFIRHPHDHGSAWLGLGAATACLVLFGASQFIIPTMLLILMALFVEYRRAKV